MLSVFMCVCVCVLCIMYLVLASSHFKSVSIVDRCTVNMNVSAPKIWALQMFPRIQYGDFLETGCYDVV
jgi:hypothetical protein